MDTVCRNPILGLFSTCHLIKPQVHSSLSFCLFHIFAHSLFKPLAFALIDLISLSHFQQAIRTWWWESTLTAWRMAALSATWDTPTLRSMWSVTSFAQSCKVTEIVKAASSIGQALAHVAHWGVVRLRRIFRSSADAALNCHRLRTRRTLTSLPVSLMFGFRAPGIYRLGLTTCETHCKN